VTADMIASGQVVKSLNGLKDDVLLSAGSNMTVTKAGNSITLAASVPAGPQGPPGPEGPAGPPGLWDRGTSRR